MADAVVQPQLEGLSALTMSARTFATDYYLPMVAARQEFTDTQKAPAGPARPAPLRWHLLPVAAMSLPGGDKPVSDGHVIADLSGPQFTAFTQDSPKEYTGSPMHNPFGRLKLVSTRDIAKSN